uniref:histidine phosphatase family protein n=1 Tax=Pararhizobium sp. IMCC3301 TaxID=3067904 RepID=UPI002742369C|nr:histidine phosphatase family protein [Pararhizobium sp. IMCC3301]
MKHVIYFVRHGETDWNRLGKLQGQQDIPLNALGRDQARRNGRTLKAHLPSLDLPFLASPMKRTSETMELVRGELGLPVSDYATDERLKEIRFGKFEGFTADEIEQQQPELAAKRHKDKFHFTPPDGESYAMLMQRVRAVVEEIDSDMVIVSHGGVSRVFRGILQNLPEADIISLPTPQDQVMQFVDGRVVLL